MNHTSTEQIVTDREVVAATNVRRTSILLTAWLGTLLLSRLPQVLLSELGVIAPSDWNIWWWIMIGALLFALTFVWPTAKPLRSYFFVLTMIYVVTILRVYLEQTSFWISWFGSERPWLAYFFGERLGIVLMSLGLAGILALLGHKRIDYFFAIGNMNAPASGIRLPWSQNPLPWSIAGPLIGLLLTALFSAGILAMNPGVTATIAGVIPLLPAILLFALMNAFGEELAYRAAPLSQLWQVVGKRQAVWMTALWFGLGHYVGGGISFGAAGAVYLTLVAVIFGKAMVETKGLGMPVFMHLLGDVVLYIIIALGSAV